MRFILPWPPSVNRYWRHPSRGPLAGRHLISTQGRDYRAQVKVALTPLTAGKKWSQNLIFSVRATPPDRRRRDIDNILKALLDAIVHAGVIEDDAHIDELHVVRMPPASPGHVEVTIEEIALG